MLEREDEILNRTDTISITDKNVTCINNCHILHFLLIITCFMLLPIVCISCYCYYFYYKIIG